MERLQKVIAHAGVASRRKAEDLIIAGRVCVNGEVIKSLGTKVSVNDKVEVDGAPIYKEEPVYFVLNKPSGVISSVKDEKNRPVVLDFFAGITQRIFPVGRLDWDTTGLILLTNDGAFANVLTHPKYEIEKVYVAKIKGVADKTNLRPLTKGVIIEGRKTKPARYEILKVDAKNQTSVVALTIHEGQNHQVKNMFQAIGLPVMKLRREQYGTLHIGKLPVGQYRKLSKKEVQQLLSLAK